jgi:hypothetical protein
MLAAFLADNGIGRVGQSIFAHSMPAECDEGVLIKLPLDGIDINQYIPGYYQTEIDVIVRAKTHEKGEALANTLMTLLHLYDTNFVDPRTKYVVMRIKQMLPMNLPIRYPRSDGNGIEFSLTFHTTYTL